MDNRHYLSEMTREELKDMILYPSQVWSELYNIVAEDNSNYASDLIRWILGNGYREWTRFDNTSYDWYMNINPGHYVRALDITDYDYFSEDDAKKVKALQKKVKDLCDKIENLEDCQFYYNKIDSWEYEADEYADEIIQIVVKLAKEAEKVTDEQVLDMFEGNDMGKEYYYIGDDKTKIYMDYTKEYKTNYKGEK